MDDIRVGVNLPNFGSDPSGMDKWLLAFAEDGFNEAHREAADLTARLGLALCIENIEVELVEPVVRAPSGTVTALP